jgi:peptidyl-prolyl cis-trans isomerase D
MLRRDIRDMSPRDFAQGVREIGRSSVILFFFLFLFSPCVAEPEIAIIVNGDNIYKDEYEYSLARYEDSYKRYFGENIDGAVREKMKKELIDDLINRQLYLQEAKRRGITAKMFASEEEIEELLMSGPAVTQEDSGARDRAEKVILSYKARQIIPPKAIAAIREDISASDKSVLDESWKRAEKIRAKYIKINPVAMANNMEISEDEIKSYYKDHSDQFRRPAQKKYAALYFDPNEYTGMVSITPQMKTDYYDQHMNDFKSDKFARIKYVLFRTKDYVSQVYDIGVNLEKYYEENIDKFVEPAEARIRFIYLKKPCDMSKLQGLLSGLKQGGPFAELAQKYSDDASSAGSGGDLGYIKEGTLKEPFNSIAFGLKDGQVSNIIETDNGYCVFSIEEKKDQHVPSFEEVKDTIEEQLLNEAAKPIALTDAKRFKIEAKNVGFEKAAGKKGFTPFETDYFKSSDRIPMIGRNLLFTSTALGMNVGDVSNEIEYDEGFAVMEVVDIKPQVYLPSSEVSAVIERRIIDEDSSVYAESAARHALDLISAGVSLKELEKRMSVHITTAEASSTLASSSEIGVIIKKNDGYYVTVAATEEPYYIPGFNLISDEVAAAAVMTRADAMADEKAQELLKSGAITNETAVETAPFSRNDYVIESEYMRPFIEQCFMLETGQTSIIKSLGKYYVVQVVERGTQLPGYTDESPVIVTQVLKEKRAEYADDWLKKERAKAQIQVNI